MSKSQKSIHHFSVSKAECVKCQETLQLALTVRMDETCQALAWGLGIWGFFGDFQGEPENQKGLRMRQIYTGNDRLMPYLSVFFFLGGGREVYYEKFAEWLFLSKPKTKLPELPVNLKHPPTASLKKYAHTQTPSASSTTKHQTVQHWWILHLPLVKKTQCSSYHGLEHNVPIGANMRTFWALGDGVWHNARQSVTTSFLHRRTECDTMEQNHYLLLATTCPWYLLL